MNNLEVPWLLPALYWIVGVAFGYIFQSLIARVKANEARRSARMMVEDAERERDAILREAGIRAQDESLKARQQFELSTQARRQELEAIEQRVQERSGALDQKEAGLEQRMTELRRVEESIRQQQSAADRADQKAQETLSHLAGLNAEQARQEVLTRAERDTRQEVAALLRRTQEEVRQQADREARKLITTAIERYAAEQSADLTTSTVRLPNDDLKARVIGKDGRNIKSFEAATGTNLIIDDTPETVVVSCFDPVRREVARVALEKLVEDGRIHPSRIEETVAKVQAEVDADLRAAGAGAVAELGLQDVDPAVAALLGRLKFRHSYGQNVLQHSLEMANVMGLLAGELGLDVKLARRIGLFHDLGKAMDQQAEGSHAQVGAEFLRRHGEAPLVVNAVAAHHNEVEVESLYAVLTKAGDAITAARPGARMETTELYLRRLEKLEAIGHGFPGVEKCYAIQAGRELRVIVEPTRLSDQDALLLARDISKAIEQQMEYPGAIKVTVIRETRCVEYAR
jgi:ribonuclease Y